MNLKTDKGRRARKWMTVFVAVLALASMALAQSVATTTVQGTVYFADGQPGSGTVQIQWPSFTTAAGQAVAAGSTSVTIGSDGVLTVNLAPNQGASPAGLFYTVTYYLSNGATNTEYWVVPDSASATLAQVRASVMPSSLAIQTVSKSYVDQAIANISQSGLASSGGTLSGPLYLAGDPSASLQAADKHYVDTAIAQTVPLSGATLTGALSGPSVRASVNSQINVMAPPYNAKGDCITDDSAAIQAAYNAAIAPQVVYFPKPPGGCYYVATPIFTKGVSTVGQAAGTNGPAVVIRGAPGKDVFNYPDPTTFTGTPNKQWTMRDITIEPDQTVDASCSPGGSCLYPNRWPGKWFGGVSITSGSPVLTITGAFNCGDIGDNVLIPNGVSTGVSLTTTIASIGADCRNSTISSVNLTTAPTNTISGTATVYITPATMSVTQMIGNAGIAMDSADGKESDWTATYVSNLHDELINVAITPYGAGGDHGLYGQNSTAGIYFGAAWNPYDFYVRGLRITNLYFGIMEGTFSINPSGSAGNNIGIGQDFQHWMQMDINATWPWISYNDGNLHIEQTQTTARNGFQFLTIPNIDGDVLAGARVDVGEFGGNGYTSPLSGFRVEGEANDFSGTALMEGSGSIAPLWDASDSKCDRCGSLQGLVINGSRNDLKLDQISGTVTDNGEGNSITSGYQASPLSNFQNPTYAVSYIKTMEPAERQSSDFLFDGNLPYFNRSDLFFWPKDMVPAAGNSSYYVVNDSTSPTGSYIPWSSAQPIRNFVNLQGIHGNTSGTILISMPSVEGNLPAEPMTVQWEAKCPSITSYTFTLQVQTTPSGGSITTVGSKTVSCSTSYAVNSFTGDLSSYGGQYIRMAISVDGVDLAWLGLVPFQASYNGYQPLNKAGDTMTGPLILNADPSVSLGAATKQYVDAHSATVTVNAFSPIGGYNGAAGTGFTANTLNYYMFNLPYSMTIAHVEYRLTTADNTANNYDIGLYSVSGTTATLIADFGATAGTTFSSSTGIKALALTQGSVSLTPGQYIFASTTNCASTCAVLAQGAVGIYTYSYNAAVGSSTGGQLPSFFTISPATTQSVAWGFGIY
ncbi:MAG: glycosyl hydrolase family 28-related protein [Terracidiphilus sp.]